MQKQKTKRKKIGGKGKRIAFKRTNMRPRGKKANEDQEEKFAT
jgi:hypothetical protein